jgi:hypothetical protein
VPQRAPMFLETDWRRGPRQAHSRAGLGRSDQRITTAQHGRHRSRPTLDTGSSSSLPRPGASNFPRAIHLMSFLSRTSPRTATSVASDDALTVQSGTRTVTDRRVGPCEVCVLRHPRDLGVGEIRHRRFVVWAAHLTRTVSTATQTARVANRNGGSSADSRKGLVPLPITGASGYLW